MASTQGLRGFAAATIPPAVVVPAALLFGVAVLYRVHRVWRWLRIGSLWSNPDNFVQLASGAGINILIGDRPAVRVAALMVYIPSRVVDCIDEYERLARAFNKWVEAIRGDYPQRPRVHWVAKPKSSIFSPSELTWLKESWIIVRIRIQKIAVTSYEVVKRMFLLSMKSVDAYEALSMKKGTCERAVRELVLDGTNAISRIAAKKAETQEKLETNAVKVNAFLKRIGARTTVDGLVTVLSTALDGVEGADKASKKVNGFAGGMVVDLGKHALLNVYSFFGMADKVSKKYMPGKWEEKYFKRKSSQKYAPTADVTQPRFSKRPPKERVIKVTMDRKAWPPQSYAPGFRIEVAQCA